MSLDSTPHPSPEPTAVARDVRVQRYLDHVQFEKRLAKRTLILYGLDLIRLGRWGAWICSSRSKPWGR